MNTRTMLPALLALLPIGTISAQTEIQKAQAPHGQATEAPVRRGQPGTPLAFSVRGLTKDNLDKVKQGLTAMETQVYRCEGCKKEQSTAGKCSGCNLDLKAAKDTLFFEAMPSVEGETIRVTPFASRTLRYSELEGALLKNSVQIDAAKFPIAGNARLVLLGGTLENVKVIEKGLADAQLFDSVKAVHDAATGQIHVTVQAGATPPTRTKVITALDALGTKVKLSDVIWGPIPATPTKA